MPVSLSKTELYSFEGDVLPLYLEDGEADLSAADVTWACAGDAVQIRRFDEDPLTPFSHGVLVTLKQIGTGTVTAIHQGNT